MTPRISIVTVCLNSVSTIEETIKSVISQDYPDIEYIIIDGGSKDGTVEIIKKYEKHLAYWVSEPDSGFGEAIQKGFAKSTGQIMAWINADDMYHPHAFKTVARIFNTFPDVRWLTGFPTYFNRDGAVITKVAIQWARWSKIRFCNYDYMAIQQESTFWKRDLWNQAGGQITSRYKLAIDLELWWRFFRHDSLYTTNAMLGGFRYSSSEQLSIRQYSSYMEESRQIIQEELKNIGTIRLISFRIRWILALFFRLFYGYDFPIVGAIYTRLLRLPKLINYNFTKDDFEKKSIWFRE